MTISVPVDRARLRGLTAPRLLCERASTVPDAVAFRAKEFGLYREYTWRDYARLVAHTAYALRALGVERGERVALMGDPCAEWLICDLAAQALGAIVYGIYPTAAVAEVEYQLRDGGAAVFIAEDQEYVDKVLAVIDRLPNLRAVVVIDDRAMFAYRHPKIRRYRALLAETAAPDLSLFAEEVRQVPPEAPAFIVYTSGTTGAPKGAVVSHGKHLAATASILDHYPTLVAKEHRTVAFLPLCHVLGRDVAITLPLLSRLVPHFGEDPEDLATTLFEVAPTVLFTVPRYLQKFAAQVLVGILSSTPLKRRCYELAMRIARAHVRALWQRGDHASARALYRFCRACVFAPLLNKLGFDRLELVISGGAPLPAETMALWHMFGVNVVEMYGQTETAGGIIAGQRGPFPSPGNVGTPPVGWEVRLADDGEVLVRNPDLFEGYWNDEAATRAVQGADGWLRTGDVAEWHRDHLKLVDRARDFLVTAGGKTVAPARIENMLRASPYIAEAVVIGHARKYLTALIEIDFDTVADWARSRNVPYTGFTSLARHPEVERLIKGEIEKVNAELARVEQIKAFRILPKALDPEEEGEPVTPTRKVKRKLMAERFRDLIEQMYDDREERLILAGAGTVLEE